MKALNTVLALTVFLMFSAMLPASTSATSGPAEGDGQVAIYFDVNVGDANKLQMRLELLDQTLADLAHGHGPLVAVIGIRGGASRFVTAGDAYVLEDELAAKHEIQKWIGRFAARSVKIEQCAIAAKMNNIANDDFLAPVEIVANGYVAMITYQKKGFSYVPMD